MEIKIGNKPLKDLTSKNVLDIAIIEGVNLFFEYWGYPNILEYDTTTFSDTYVLDFFQERISDGVVGKTIVFFFCFRDMSFHWHFMNEQEASRKSKRIKFETIRYLIKEGFDIPLYEN